MRWLLLLLVPLASAAPSFSAVVPDLPGSHDGDEGLALISAVDWSLDGHWLTDGEGEWPFPPGAQLSAGVETWIVGNASAWALFDGPSPAWTFDLRLGNSGDDVRLMGPSGVLDEVVYTENVLSGRAQVLRPDWVTPRIHRMGESALDAPMFAGSVTAYASPDSAHDVLEALILGATNRVHLHVYQLGQPSLVEALADAAVRVDVQVMVEDHPVGTDSEERAHADAALHAIEAAGGQTFRAGSVRYAFHHLKVLVADDTVAVQSENWVPSGVPLPGTDGNRGWGVTLHDAASADWFASWMEADREAWDTDPANPQPGTLWRKPAAQSIRGVEAMTAEASWQPFISPDHTADPSRDPVIALVHNATSSIDVQQLDLALWSRNNIGWAAPDGFTAALAEAAERGVRVRAQAAAPFHSDDTGNREALAWLEQRGVDVSEWPGDGVLHNKGLIVDGRWTVIGSMNGNHHSRSNNREAGVIVDSVDVAAYYMRLFEEDWAPSASIDWQQVVRDLERVPVSPWPILLALTAVACLQRCSPWFPFWQLPSSRRR